MNIITSRPSGSGRLVKWLVVTAVFVLLPFLWDAVLLGMVQGVRVTRTPAEGGSRVMFCLPLDHINRFLFGILSIG